MRQMPAWTRTAFRVFVHTVGRAIGIISLPALSGRTLAGPQRLPFAIVRLRHNRSHREGWRERPYETPATTEPTVRKAREGANSVGRQSGRCDRKRFGLRVTETERRPISYRGSLGNARASASVQGMQDRVPAGSWVRM